MSIDCGWNTSCGWNGLITKLEAKCPPDHVSILSYQSFLRTEFLLLSDEAGDCLSQVTLLIIENLLCGQFDLRRGPSDQNLVVQFGTIVSQLLDSDGRSRILPD